MADDTWQMIQNRMDVMADRNKRMDDTAELLQWDDNPYQLVKPDGKTELRDAISVTPNLPKVFAHGVKSDLLGGHWQTVVEGNISGRQSHYVESFVEDGLAQADEFILNEHGIPSLFSWLCNHVLVRWAIGTRYISQVVDGEYQIDSTPVDMRWTPFVLGKWVAPITFWAEDELKEKLEKYEKHIMDAGGVFNKVSLKKEDNEQRDFWNSEKHELWVEKKLVFTEPNHFGYYPFVIVVPSSGFMLRDKGYLKHEGEDILFLNAGLYREFARSVSLEQTSGYAGLYPAMEYETQDSDASPSQPPPGIDETLKRKPGELHKPVPRGDINRAGQTGRVDILDMLDAGGPRVPKEYNQPPSAILLAGETELISRLQNSRKEALGIFKSQLARMMIKQFIEVGEGEFTIGKEGKRSKYSPSKLGDPDKYTITYHLTVKSKRQELANLTEFIASYDRLPLKWNLTNILMVDDPDGVIEDLELEKAKKTNPAISFLEMAVKYARRASDTEDELEADLLKEQSKILTHEYVMAMRQRTQPATAPTRQVEEPKGDTRLLTSLAAGALGGEGGGQRGRCVQPQEIL